MNLQIHKAKTKMLEPDDFSRADNDDTSSIPTASQLKLLFKATAVFVGFSASEPIAVMNEETARVLRDLSIMKSCRFEAYYSKNIQKLSIAKEKAERNMYLLVDIVLYGSTAIRKSVGRLLSTARIYLQHPSQYDSNTDYDNPHVLNLTELLAKSGFSTPSLSGTQTPTITTDTVDLTSEVTEENEQSQQLQSKLSKVFNSLTRYKSLKRLEADIKVKTSLLG